MNSAMKNHSMKDYSMKNMQVLSVAVALALTSAAAFAQVQQTTPDRAKQRMQLDVNQDGVIDRTEAAKAPKLAARFDQLDTNKDGKLSADELSHMRGKHDGRGMAGGHNRMMALDTDKDGRISRAEAMAAKGKFADRFDKMDVNKDGYIDRADMQARMTQERAEFFKGADANRDGRVTREEFIVEQGARSAERREKRASHAQAAGKQASARPALTGQQQIAFAGKAFDAMDSNKDGVLTRAEFDAFKPKNRGMRQGMNDRMDDAQKAESKP
jgi:Ca2+-binding EF-hand superfamily protein